MASQLGAPSLAVFCPQSKAPQKEYLDEIRRYICSDKRLKELAKEVKCLGETWNVISERRKDIAALHQGSRYMQALSDWVEDGQSEPVANIMSGILSLPLLVIIQVTQYFQFLETSGMSHRGFLAGLKTGKGAGVQGYCAGLLPAFAIACAKDEDDLVITSAKAMRLALAIGAYGELGDEQDLEGPTTIVLRLKYVGQGDAIVKKFPGAYVSAITDPRTVSIVGPVRTLESLSVHAQEQGLLVQSMHLRGKVHNPENVNLAAELCCLCDQHYSLQLPYSDKLQVQVNSNKDGKPLTDCDLTHEAIQTILATRCEWYTLLQNVAQDLSVSKTVNGSHTFALFGIGDPVPLAPFHQARITVTKIEIYKAIKEVHLGDYAFNDDAIAIVGASCRLPGANNLDNLWDLISSGTSKCEEVRSNRASIQSSFRASLDSTYAKKSFYGNFIDDIDLFDHAFFKMNAKEASYMDPQQRILLELAYQAMDSSGYLRHHKRKDFDKVGCFIGASFTEYLENTSSHAPTAYSATGTIRAFLCGKISYYFGWSGPSEVIDTACSSSLVAIHRACRAITAGECPMALAGGVNIITGVHNYIDLSKAGFLSPTGQCKPFDKSADGYCRADGAGLVVLKRLADAQANGDHILGVITGVATNQGGLSSSITIPHSPSQVDLYNKILHQSRMSPDHVTYVEAHGTGTQAGDPLEISSIREVFGGPERISSLSIGSLKGNIGHSETAAGVAGLLKVLAMLKHGKIPPLASYKSLNPKIPALALDKMVITKEVINWDAPIRVACVNSYGAAGSNAALLCSGHLLPRKDSVPPEVSTAPIIISAPSKEGLLAYTHELEKYLSRNGPSIGDVAFTLAERRQHHRFLWSVVTSNIDDLCESMRSISETQITDTHPPRKVVLAFGGQSKQTVGLSKMLYDFCPRLRYHIHYCDKLLVELGFPSIIPDLFSKGSISDVVVLQTSTFVVQYACARCWIDSGLHVDAVIGHSFGELTALVVSGTLSLIDGLKVVGTRAMLMASKWGSERGIMLAVHSSQDMTHDLISRVGSRNIEVACYNVDTSQVLVGSSESISEAERILGSDSRFRGIRYQKLEVTHGFHSRFTEPLLDDLLEVAKTVSFRPPNIHLETCTLEPSDSKLLPSHLVRHTRKPVYFVNAVRRLEERLGACTWLEAGFDSPIISMLKRSTGEGHLFQGLTFGDQRGDDKILSSVVTKLWNVGAAVSFWPFLSPQDAGVAHIWLPPHPFTKTKAWVDNIDRAVEAQKILQKASEPPTAFRPSAPSRLITPVKEGPDSATFTVHTGTNRFSRLVSGHAVRGRPLCPASMYMECATMAARSLHGDTDSSKYTLHFEDISFESPLGIDPNRMVFMNLDKSAGPRTWRFALTSSPTSPNSARAITHGKGTLGFGEQPRLDSYQRLISAHLKELAVKAGTETLMSKRAYNLFSQVVTYADTLRGISSITMDDRQASAIIQVPDSHVGVEESTAIDSCDTVTLDAFIQVIGLLLNSSDNCTAGYCFVATGVKNAMFSSACDFVNTRSWKVYAMYDMVDSNKAAGDVFIMTPDTTVVGIILGVSFSKISIDTLESILDTANAPSSSKPAPRNMTRPTSEPVYQDLADDSGYSTKTIATPVNEGSCESNLKALISTYSGMPVDTLTADLPIGELGIDSLAAVELAADMVSQFAIDVSPSDLVQSSLGTLARTLDVKTTSPTSSLVPALDKAVQSSPNNSAVEGAKSERRATALNIIKDITGAEVSGIPHGQRLSELGVDSLAIVQLKGDLESAFSLEIDDSNIHLDLTIRQILQIVEADSPPSSLHSSLPLGQDVPTPIDPRLTEVSAVPRKPIQPRGGPNPPAYIGNLAEFLPHSEASLPEMANNCGYKAYWNDIARHQDGILVAYILEAYRDLGIDLWELRLGEEVPDIKYLPKYSRLMNRILHILQKHCIIESMGASLWVRAQSAWPRTSSRELVSKFINDYPRFDSEVKLLSITGSQLAACLTGDQDPLKLLFSNRDSQGVLENFYTHSPMLATATEFLVDVIRKSIASSKGNTVRIVEIGAGFGGTTKRVLDAIKASGPKIEYTYTDIASTLVSRASKAFGDVKGIVMDFQTLNTEVDPPTEMKGRYDLAISTNCVHATRDKANSIRNIKNLLNPEGFMILSEVTEIIDWYDIVYGLLDGWWLADDDSYPLQSPESWMRYFRKAGLNAIYSQGPSRDLNTQRLLIASQRPLTASLTGSSLNKAHMETVTYKEVDGVKIHADIYLPQNPAKESMAIGLMIHGGGHMTLSRKAIRPAQTEFLLASGILPVSLDYRLCPEVNLINGPITDVCDAYIWAQKYLPDLVRPMAITLDIERIVVIGWSTGGQLAMTLAWTLEPMGVIPPKAILSFYSPTDFESGDLDVRRAEEYPQRQMAMSKIIQALPRKPITGYDAGDMVDATGLGWVKPGDPRSELVLSLFKEGNGLPLLLNGISDDGDWNRHLNTAQVAAISPLAQVRNGTYKTPTFVVHGNKDEIVPYETAVRFVKEMREQGVECGFLTVEGAKHIHDLKLKPGTTSWEAEVAPGYEFLLRKLLQ